MKGVYQFNTSILLYLRSRDQIKDDDAEYERQDMNILLETKVTLTILFVVDRIFFNKDGKSEDCHFDTEGNLLLC